MGTDHRGQRMQRPDDELVGYPVSAPMTLSKVKKRLSDGQTKKEHRS